MKYSKRVFAMEESELRAVLALLRGRQLAKADKQTMQEELVAWLLSEGLTARHEFLLFKNDIGEGGKAEVWPLMSRRAPGVGRDTSSRCTCCDGQRRDKGDQEDQCHSLASPLPSARRPVPPRPPPPPFRLQQNKVADAPATKKIIVVQPMPGESCKSMRKDSGKKPTPPPQRECCVECGQFCVDFLSTLK